MLPPLHKYSLWHDALVCAFMACRSADLSDLTTGSKQKVTNVHRIWLWMDVFLSACEIYGPISRFTVECVHFIVACCLWFSKCPDFLYVLLLFYIEMYSGISIASYKLENSGFIFQEKKILNGFLSYNLGLRGSKGLFMKDNKNKKQLMGDC